MQTLQKLLEEQPGRGRMRGSLKKLTALPWNGILGTFHQQLSNL